LTKKSTSLEDLQGIAVSLQIGRELDATGVITGSLYEEKRLHRPQDSLCRVWPSPRERRFFNDSDESVRLTETEPLKDMLFQRSPNYARDPDAIPDEPGVVKFDAPGVSPPSCVTVRTRNILMLRGLRNFKAR